MVSAWTRGAYDSSGSRAAREPLESKLDSSSVNTSSSRVRADRIYRRVEFEPFLYRLDSSSSRSRLVGKIQFYPLAF